MRDSQGWSALLFGKWRFLSAIIASLLMDLAFLIFWSLALVGFDKVVDYVDPAGTHKLIGIAKVIFELSTLAVVVFYTVADITKIVARIRAENRKELTSKGADTRRIESGE